MFLMRTDGACRWVLACVKETILLAGCRIQLAVYINFRGLGKGWSQGSCDASCGKLSLWPAWQSGRSGVGRTARDEQIAVEWSVPPQRGKSDVQAGCLQRPADLLGAWVMSRSDAHPADAM